MKTLRKEDLSRIGSVQKISGFKGAVSCRLDDFKEAELKKEKFIFILLEGLPVPFEVEKSEISGDEMTVKFFDIDTEAQARKLIRKEIFSVKKNGKRKKTDLGWKDLIGFHVTDVKAGDLGSIKDVIEYPMQMLALCIVNGKEVLFPLNEEFVTEIIEKEKKITVDLPEGLLDL